MGARLISDCLQVDSHIEWAWLVITFKHIYREKIVAVISDIRGITVNFPKCMVSVE